ncbi:hypothetical protein F5Y12DRAFT_39791 [Xylaria sp. FL1777]|nr:hypothetical protein F5Y12DRAFT_39791 [Xylaria sp. FL1777]
MNSQDQTQEIDSQDQTGSEQVQEYVSLRDLELIPSAKQPIFKMPPLALPQPTSAATNANSKGQETRDADKRAQENDDLSPTPADSPPKGVSLRKLWAEPGVKLSEVNPTAEECEEYQQERDGLAEMITGPSCSVCGEPFTFEVLAKGMSCNVCGFI